MLWGKLIGCCDAVATAGRRPHEDTAKTTRMTKSASPTAATPALAFVDSRMPSAALENACAPYHERKKQVNSDSGQSGQRVGGGSLGRYQVSLRVGERDERRFELRGRQVHPAR